MNLYIYDNEEDFKSKLKSALEALPVVAERFKIISVSEQEFQDAVRKLVDRQLQVRENHRWSDDNIFLDDADIFVIDFDLLTRRSDATSINDISLTGERVSYLARCFSACRLIIGINQFPLIDFDLTLKGHLDSFADLNITDRCLSNPGLWGEAATVFRPWYWPNLIRYINDFEARVHDTLDGLDTPIYQVVGIPKEIFENLPRSVGSFLGKQPLEVTPRTFALESGNGLRRKDEKLIAPEALSRLAASRISKWIERWMLPGQDILVDAPHLVSRFPSLLKGDIGQIETWNKSAILAEVDALGLKSDVIEDSRLSKSHWISRPVWFWDKIRELETIDEVREPWKIVFPNWAFCEDISKFEAKECTSEFVAEVGSPYSRRFLKKIEGFQYNPLYRLSL